jgi:hypothetical protein
LPETERDGIAGVAPHETAAQVSRLTDPPACTRIDFVRRFKLYVVFALVAFFRGVVSGQAVRAAARGEAATFPREQSRDFLARAIPRERFEDNGANNFFPC